MGKYISNDKDIVIIIGAGASFDHSRNRDDCPPLGECLASSLRKELPEFVSIEEKVKKKCGIDFEQWMEDYASKDISTYTGVLWCLSKYFSKYKDIQDDSLYLELTKRIDTEKAFFISLNYEALLELAIRREGYHIDPGVSTEQDNFNNISSQVIIPVLKPHGSVNYRAIDSSSNYGTTLAGKITIGDNQKNIIFKNINIKKIEISESGQCIVNGSKLDEPKEVNEKLDDISKSNHSIVCAYNPKKTANINHDFINKVREHIFNRMTSCSKMVLIGINHKPNDEFINKVVLTGLKAGADVRFIGSKVACENYFGSRDTNFLGTTFRESLDELVEFLNN